MESDSEPVSYPKPVTESNSNLESDPEKDLDSD